ncbi:hypothetical protein [Agaribacterium sp. ZY112]|uniref:hypothetical protein n=1 Tax=Agaribacterium sp. ZY112 TaxID=3233574 RepID=UPI003526A08A
MKKSELVQLSAWLFIINASLSLALLYKSHSFYFSGEERLFGLALLYNGLCLVAGISLLQKYSFSTHLALAASLLALLSFPLGSAIAGLYLYARFIAKE